MATYVQADRPLAVSTPLGKDGVLLVGLTGHEGISQLFRFQLELLADNATTVGFDKLLGNVATVHLTLADGKDRYFSGICSRVSEGARGEMFTRYDLEIVPQFWLLTRKAQSRIFQQMTVPDILKKVLTGLKVTYEIQGAFEPRDFCVQYRETDFNFASRLMEEEGIYYFFKHADDGHTMVLANTPQSHPDLPGRSRIVFEELEGGARDEDRIDRWVKSQELRSGKYTLWDHCFELPHKHLEAEDIILDSAKVGKVTHRLKVGGNDELEIYDYPGEYAQRFDGVDRGGAERAGDLQKIFQDNSRTTKIRMQQEALPGLILEGSSNCRHFTSGYKFTLERHFNADGQYVLTGVSHAASLPATYRSAEGSGFTYSNTFTCIPAAVPFRPVRTTPKPVVQGTQTAVVVGPPGEEIFTDKYGRVKVQFHWDREGKGDSSASCWIRVGQSVAGKSWGSVFIPRIGQEVMVAFLEGDPDQPIIVGSAYNAREMPPYQLPDDKTKTVLLKSNSTPGGDGFNEIRIEDKKGEEQIFIHAERNQDIRVKKDLLEFVGENAHHIVKKDQFELIEADRHDHVKGDENRKVDGTLSLQAGMDMQEKVGQNYALDSGTEIHLKAGMNVVVEAGVQLTIKVGGNFININPGGIFISGTMVMINSGGAAGSGAGSSPQAPQDPKEADTAKSGQVSEAPPAGRPPKPYSYSPAAVVLQRAAQNGTPFCEPG
jgi:type VI secretion system secreted protein VgrG